MVPVRRNDTGTDGNVADQQLIGKTGRVTGRIVPGRIGEVMVPVRGGTEAFHAHGAGDEEIAPGTRVLVVEVLPPRTVVVTPL